MRVGIFGGRFDPIHVGHLILAYDSLELFGFDKVIFLVSCRPPHKRVFASFQDRLNMVKLATLGETRFSVSDIEKRFSFERSYTALVLPHFKNYGQIYFLMG